MSQGILEATGGLHVGGPVGFVGTLAPEAFRDAKSTAAPGPNIPASDREYTVDYNEKTDYDHDFKDEKLGSESESGPVSADGHLYVNGEPVVENGEDVSNYVVDERDDGDAALTFRSWVIGTIIAGLGAALAQVRVYFRPRCFPFAPNTNFLVIDLHLQAYRRRCFWYLLTAHHLHVRTSSNFHIVCLLIHNAP